jgi:transposase InsO family protein
VLQRCPRTDLVHHPDQGSTYASEDYQDVLTAHGITRSMSGRVEVLDNAAMENWNSTFKFECGERFETDESAETKTFDYIEVFYNRQPRHSALGYVSPAGFERTARTPTVRQPTAATCTA